MRCRLSQRHLPWQPCHDPLRSGCPAERLPDRVTEVTDELRRLMAEFETELAILKGRVDGLEAKVGELSNSVLHHHKLKGKTTFAVGAVNYEGAPTNGGEGFAFQYDTRLGLKTSFTGGICSSLVSVLETWITTSLQKA